MSDKPFGSCPMLCSIYPTACAECSAYKRKLEELYEYIDNSDAYYEKFVIDPTAAPGGECNCEFCGAPIDIGNNECDYCGYDVNSTNTLVRVRNKNDVPNPITEAVKIIYERKKMEYRYRKEHTGILKAVTNFGSKSTYKMNDYDHPMSVSDVSSVAASYGVNIRKYLEGLDSGQYMTYKGNNAMNNINNVINSMNTANYNSSYSGGYSGGSGGYSSSSRTTKPYTPLDYQSQRAASSAPGYMGKASGSCCGTCSYYVASTKECLNNSYRHPSGPNDYCGDYRD